VTNPRAYIALARGRLNRLRRRLAVAGRLSFWQETAIRYLWQRPLWFTDKYGVRLRLYPEDNLRTVLATRSHFDDEPVIKLVNEIVTPGMTVVDVGANHGQFTVIAAQLTGEEGRVHSFEPAARSFARLSENVNQSETVKRRVRLNESAVSDQPGVATLYEFPPGFSAWNSLGAHAMDAGGRYVEPSHTSQVPVTTLDEYCREQGIELIDLLKVDVEGFEVEVLRGCKALLGERRIRKVIFEISLEPLKASGRTANDVLGSIAAMGFDIWLIGAELKRVNLPEFEAPYFANYLATPS
jgi:FkbM family methyltransferase